MKTTRLQTPNEMRMQSAEGALMRGFSNTLAALCGLVLGTVLFANVAAAQQVQGGLMFTLDDSNWVHTFTARQDADGTVTGRALFSRRDGNSISFRSELRIDCMLFLDENTVILGGVTIRDTDPEFVGSTFVFVVRDNGEGHVLDQATDVFYSVNLGFEIDCDLAAFLLETEFDLEDLFDPAVVGDHVGNVQVQP